MRLVDEFSKRVWNIGFCDLAPKQFIEDGKLPEIKWMKHSFGDRWFADPFIYKVTENKITVFVEEYPFLTKKGILCELEIDRKTMRLIGRHVLLDLSTHLSYPIWVQENGQTFVYPENGESGQLSIYEYNEEKHTLENPKVILNEAVADASIVQIDKTYYLIATKYPNTQENLFLYKASSIEGPYMRIYDNPVQSTIGCSRPGGNWFVDGFHVYRPAQNCEGGYGRSLSIMETWIKQSEYSENVKFDVLPNTFKYHFGLHTINFLDGVCVVDSRGYKYPIIGRLLDFIRKVLR